MQKMKEMENFWSFWDDLEQKLFRWFYNKNEAPLFFNVKTQKLYYCFERSQEIAIKEPYERQILMQVLSSVKVI